MNKCNPVILKSKKLYKWHNHVFQIWLQKRFLYNQTSWHSCIVTAWKRPSTLETKHSPSCNVVISTFDSRTANMLCLEFKTASRLNSIVSPAYSANPSSTRVSFLCDLTVYWALIQQFICQHMSPHSTFAQMIIDAQTHMFPFLLVNFVLQILTLTSRQLK